MSNGRIRVWFWEIARHRNSPEVDLVLLGINLDSSSTEPVLERVEVLLEVAGCSGAVCVGRKHRQMQKGWWNDVWRRRVVYNVENRRKDTSLGPSCV